MPTRNLRILVPFLVVLLLVLAFYLFFNVTNYQDEVAAYPPPMEAMAATSGPYPGPYTPGPVNPAAPAPATAMTGTPYFLPIADRAVPFHFGVDAAREVDTAVLVPDAAFRVDGLIWGFVPQDDRQVQMPRRCKGRDQSRHEKYMCWISNDWTVDAPYGEVRRDNIAGISSPANYDPTVTSDRSGYRGYMATDGVPGSHWVSGTTASQLLTIPELHPVSVELVVLDWYLGDANGVNGTYAKSYTIEVDVDGSIGENWQTIYQTTNGNGGDNDVLSLADDFSGFGYNGETAYQIRFTLTERGNIGTNYYYGVTDFEVYGTVEDQLFLRKEDPNDPGSSEVWWEMWIKNHPGHLWFIGNEPDNFDLSAGDGMTPKDYGAFYARAATFIKENDPSAQLIFCQGTRGEFHTEITPMPTPPPTHTPGPTPTAGWAPNHPHGSGAGYCDLALAETESALLELNAWYTLDAFIDGFSTHQYIYGKIDNQSARETRVAEWQDNLGEFENWVNDLTDESLDQHPLYLTEYGDFDNACASTPTPGTPPNPSPTPYGGPNSGCGQWFENHAWFGPNAEEGFYAIQFYTSKYYLQPCINPSQTDCNAQWVSAWWFLKGEEPGEAYIGGLLLNDEVNPPIPNDGGVNYRNNIDCLVNDINCPPTLTPTP